MTGTVNDLQVEIPPRKTSRGKPLFENEPTTLPELFRHAALKHDLPDALNYKHAGAWRPISTRQMLDRIECIACGLISLGLSKGD